MANVIFVALVAVSLIAIGAWLWRYTDVLQDRAEMSRLLAQQPADPGRFSYDMIADLPEPVQRYFRFMIAEGTPLLTVAQLKMRGEFSLGTRDNPQYMAMQSKQVLAWPDGFVWVAQVRKGHLWFSGSDTGDWTRFWAWDLAPVARAGGSDDHARSAVGRMVAEAVFWTPAALLPGETVRWSVLENGALRVSVTQGDLVQDVDITIAEDGQPKDVTLMRWSNANADRVFRLQSFGGKMSDFREVQGFRVPMRVEAGNFFGAADYFPFFIAEVTDISYPSP